MTAQTPSSAKGQDPVDALVAAVLEQLSAGDATALDEQCAQHPEFAAEIRARVAALSEMSLLPSGPAAMAFPERLGDFRLLRRLGGGGMGVVYEARQESLGRTVALKLIRPEHLYFAKSRERFQRETEAVARLAHPGIVCIHTVGEARGTPYFAMEMIQGATLAQVLEQLAPLAPESLVGSDLHATLLALAPGDANLGAEHVPDVFAGSWPGTCARVILRMTEALEHAHGRGVLHRDIKPSNIAVTAEGRVVLLDFGLAGFEHELRLTATGSALGSVLYMAPEQVASRAHEIDARTDVYALGVTLYELLTLQTPFGGSDHEQTRAAILDGSPQPIRARHRAVPRDLELVCLKAMERDRARRYASMAAFGADLRNVLEGRAIQARPPSTAYRARRWMLRHPTKTTAAVLGSLFVTVVPSLLYFQQRASSRELQRSLEAQTQARNLAAEESARANAKAAEAELVATFLVEIYGAADPYSAGRRDVTAREVLDAGVARVEQDLAGQLELQALLFDRIGTSYTNLDSYEQALRPLERALELRRELHGDDDPRTTEARVQLASALRLSGRSGVVELLMSAHDALVRQGTQADPTVAIHACTLLAMSLLDENDTQRALALLAEAHERRDALGDERLDLRRLVLTTQATVYNRLEQYERAEESALEALALPALEEHQSTPWRIAALDCLAIALTHQGRLDEAREVYSDLLLSAREFYDEGSVVLAQMELDAAALEARLGDERAVATTAERAFSLFRATLGPVNTKTLTALSDLSGAWLRAGRLDDAQALIDGVAREIEDALGEREPRLPSVLYLSGVAALARGDLAAAQPTLRRARELDADVLPSERGALDTALARALIADPAARGECNELARSALAQGDRPAAFVARWVLARLALAERRAADAETELRAAIEADPTATGWPTAACRELLAEILIARGELDEGCAMLESAVPALERALGARHADVLEVRTRLAQNGVTASCAARAR